MLIWQEDGSSGLSRDESGRASPREEVGSTGSRAGLPVRSPLLPTAGNLTYSLGLLSLAQNGGNNSTCLSWLLAAGGSKMGVCTAVPGTQRAPCINDVVKGLVSRVRAFRLRAVGAQKGV